jgi:hypothetical protein
MRGKCELPEIDQYDIYISTGGPGNPLIGDGAYKNIMNLLMH